MCLHYSENLGLCSGQKYELSSRVKSRLVYQLIDEFKAVDLSEFT